MHCRIEPDHAISGHGGSLVRLNFENDLCSLGSSCGIATTVRESEGVVSAVTSEPNWARCTALFGGGPWIPKHDSVLASHRTESSSSSMMERSSIGSVEGIILFETRSARCNDYKSHMELVVGVRSAGVSVGG